MKTLLVQAWEDYHAWCKENKVHPGQGRFTPGLVLAVNDGHFFPKWTDLGFA
jgi:hypothetical protein